jgi:ribosomal protein S18 acetylase RimI-like enzyme
MRKTRKEVVTMTGKTAKKKNLKVSIREMKEEDIEGVLSLDRKITGIERAVTYIHTPMRYLGGELALSVIAENEGKIVGFLLGQMVRTNYQLGDTAVAQIIGVDPDFTRHGIGTGLVQAFMTFCKNRGIDKVHSVVNVNDKLIISFLRSMDFSRGEMVDFVKSLD